MATQSERITKDFNDQLGGMLATSMLTLSVSLASELKVFEVLGSISSKDHPVSAEEVAEKGDFKPRYIQELLSALACGDIIEVTECGTKFWMIDEKKAVLVNPNTSSSLSMFTSLPSFGKVYYDIKNVCKKDGPLGMQYDAYDNFYSTMASFSESLHKKYLKPEVVPLSEMKEKLESEEKTECLDVGCGNGFHVLELAKYYPNSNFTGLDITKHAIDQANDKLKNENLKNVTFVNMNAAEMKKEWDNKFDWITIFDACHDQCRPDLSLKEIHRCLKPDGVFTMVEIKGSSNCYTDKKMNPYFSMMLYSISLFHCLPVGNSTKDALGLGAMWGQERAIKMLKEAGFSSVEIVPTPFFPLNLMYKCKK